MNAAKEAAPADPDATGNRTLPEIVLFGDSHAHSVQRAIDKRRGKEQPVPLAAHRLLKEKNGAYIGDTSLDDFLKLIGKLTPTDVVLSMIGGNQHAVYSTIQHDQPFDFLEPGEPAPTDSDRQLIPYHAIEMAFESGLRRGDGKSLQAIRAATDARVVHIIPPPPKADNAFIEEHHESLFATSGLATRGVSPPELRLKFWRLQTHVLEMLCAEFGIELLLPPGATLDERGFLKPEYYARDATHANWRYGERVLRQVERRFLRTPARGKPVK